MINMLSVHLWWWFGLSFWFLLSCPPAGCVASLVLICSSFLLCSSLPYYCLSSALAAIKQPRHFFACQVVHLYECVVEGAVCRGCCESGARQSDERASVYLDAVEFCACEATHFCFPSLHQKTTKFHRPTAGYSDQCAGRPFLVLLLIPSDQRRERSLCFASRFFEIQVAGRCVSRSVLLPSYCPSFRKQTRNFVASEIARFILCVL
jgi:hypothetical protein